MWRRAHVAAGRPPPLIHDLRLVDQAFMRKVTRLEMFSQMHIRPGQEEEVLRRRRRRRRRDGRIGGGLRRRKEGVRGNVQKGNNNLWI